LGKKSSDTRVGLRMFEGGREVGTLGINKEPFYYAASFIFIIKNLEKMLKLNNRCFLSTVLDVFSSRD